MASSALCCPVRQVLVHVYPGSGKAWSEPRVTVHIGRRGRPVSKETLDNPADLRDDFFVIAGLARVHGRQAARIR